MSPSRWVSQPPVQPAVVDLAECELAVRVHLDPAGLYQAVPVVVERPRESEILGFLLAWARPPGQASWVYALLLWPDRREDYRGKLAWSWRSQWCIFDRRMIRRATEREALRSRAAHREALSNAIRAALPPGYEPGPDHEPAAE